MPQSPEFQAGSLRERLHAQWGTRATGIVLALALEAILILLLLTLGQFEPAERAPETTLVKFEAKPVAEETPPQHETPPPDPQPAERSAPQPEPAEETPRPVQSQERPAPPPFIPIPREQVEAVDISRLPRAPAAPDRPTYGPPSPPASPDTQRVGTAPNGEPLYAASWYREPRDDELAGYLSTARGPGWGLIACRTVPDYRVEDCVGIEEYPRGSNIMRSVLAAAWQFRVRPPRLGGQLRVGEWVRIRIDYDLRRR